MGQRRLRALVAVFVAMVCAGVVSVWFVPGNNTAYDIPDRWRDGRWEMSRQGVHARELAESTCGALPQDAWLDFPEEAPAPVLRDGPDDLTRCFDEQVAPSFARQPL